MDATSPEHVAELLHQVLDRLTAIESRLDRRHQRRPDKVRYRPLRAAVVADRLGIPLTTFRSTYQRRFTDCWPPDKRTKRVPVLIPDDEVDLVETDGWEALADYRRDMGRLRRAELARRRAG